MKPRCRRAAGIWPAWLAGTVAVFAVAEYRAFVCGCHPTLSRELHRWLRCERNRYAGPVLFGALAAGLAAHIALIEAEQATP